MLVVYLVEPVVPHGAVASVNLDNLLVVVLGVGELLIVVRNVLAFSGAESGVEQDGVLHSCTSFHFTILIDVLLMSYYSFLKDGTNVESPSPEGLSMSRGWVLNFYIWGIYYIDILYILLFLF